jgi:hypothetical protein
MRTRVSLLFVTVAVCVLPAASAFAYLDAGTGSLLIQLAMGAFLGALLTIRLWWAKLKMLVVRIAGRREKDNGDG